MIAYEDFLVKINTPDYLKAYLESLEPNQIGGVTGSPKLYPMALCLRLRYQDETVEINPVIASMGGFEVLTPIWLREYLKFFEKSEQELQTVATCLILLNRVIEEQTPLQVEELTA